MAQKSRLPKNKAQKLSPIKFSERKDVSTDLRFSSLLKCVPDAFEGISFSDLKCNDNFNHKYVFGKIVQIWPVRKRPKNGHLRKLLISDALEENSSGKLSVFLFDKYASDSEGAEVDDFIIICDLMIENLTNLSQRTQNTEFIPFQLLVQHDDQNHPDRSIWISRTVAARDEINSTVPQINLKGIAPKQVTHSSPPKKVMQGTINGDARPTRTSQRIAQRATNDDAGSSKSPARASQKTTSNQTNPYNLRRRTPQKSGSEASSPTRSHSKTPPKSGKEPSSSSQEQHLPSYQYSTLIELSVSPDESKLFHIYGIVDDCQIRTNSASNAQTLELLLCDQTRSAFRCTIYTSNKKDEGPFPNVHPGDIVRIHRLKVIRVRGELRGSCLSHKFIVIFTKEEGESHPKTTAKTFEFTDDDKETVRKLFDWHNELNAPKLICDIKPFEEVSFIAQVIGVYVSKGKQCVVVKIWDGTNNENLLSDHLGLNGEQIDDQLYSVAESYYVNLFVYGNYCFTAGELKPGQYVIVRHSTVTQRSPSSSHKLVISVAHKEGKGIFVLQDDDPQIVELKSRLEKITEDANENIRRQNASEKANNFFLNCEIATPVEKPPHNEQSQPEISENNQISNGQASEVVSVTHAAVLPGQSSQEFGGIYEELSKKRKSVNQDSPTNQNDEENMAKRQRTSDTNGDVTPELQNILQGAANVIAAIPQSVENHVSQSLSQKNTQDLSSVLSDSSQDLWWKSLPDPVSVTEGHGDIAPWTIAEVMKKPAPYKFHIIAAVLNLKPETRSIEKLIRLYCSLCHFLSKIALISEILHIFEVCCVEDELPLFFCPNCKASERDKYPLLEYSFLIDLTLHDGGSEMIEAYLWRDSAVKFFKGITPKKALLSKPMANSVFEMLWKVCPNCRPKEVVANADYAYYPVLDCCVKSYNFENSVHYQIFDTIII